MNAQAQQPGSSSTRGPRRASLARRFFRQPVVDVIAGLEQLATTRRPGAMMIGMVAIGIVTWFVYVPIHELLHVAGCVVTGGTITELELPPRYGGSLLAKVFPWVVTESQYAGRLSGFSTHGSDLGYLATDFGPFLLTVVIGVPLIKLCKRRGRPILFPIAIVLGLAPFYNMQGDYYEMGSIIATRAATPLLGPSEPVIGEDGKLHPPCPEIQGSPTAAYRCLRADDIFKLFTDFFTEPAKLHVQSAGPFTLGLVIILIGLVLDVLLAFLTYRLGHLFSRLFIHDPRAV